MLSSDSCQCIYIQGPCTAALCAWLGQLLCIAAISLHADGKQGRLQCLCMFKAEPPVLHLHLRA